MRQNQLKALNDCRRIVVKVGTGLLADENGFRPEMIQKLAREIHFLKKANRQVILVSSGAVGAGREVLKRRSDYEPLAEPGLSRKQALAAIGQVHLISEYSRLFSDTDIFLVSWCPLFPLHLLIGYLHFWSYLCLQI